MRKPFLILSLATKNCTIKSDVIYICLEVVNAAFECGCVYLLRHWMIERCSVDGKEKWPTSIDATLTLLQMAIQIIFNLKYIRHRLDESTSKYTCVYFSSPLSYFMLCLFYCDCTKDIFQCWCYFEYTILIWWMNFAFLLPPHIKYYHFTTEATHLKVQSWFAGSWQPHVVLTHALRNFTSMQMYISIHFYWCNIVQILKKGGYS